MAYTIGERVVNNRTGNWTGMHRFALAKTHQEHLQSMELRPCNPYNPQEQQPVIIASVSSGTGLQTSIIGAVAGGEGVSEKGPYVEPRGHTPLMPAIVYRARRGLSLEGSLYGFRLRRR